MRGFSILLFLPVIASMACGVIGDGPGVGDVFSPSSGSGNGPSGAPTFEGLPCEIADLLETHCIACHTSPPAQDVPMSLVTYDDLLRPSPSDPSRTVAQMCVVRMHDTADPMPPGGLLPAADVAAFEAWVAAGAPKGDCGTAGTGGGPGIVCSSDTYWAWDSDPPNEDLAEQMNPGKACIECHTDPMNADGEERPPAFLVAGTVYPTVHEPDLCYGAEGATIVVIDAIGRIVTMTSNATGNFFYEDIPGALTFPIEAKLTFNGTTVAMSDPVDSGDCNSCHTQDGADMAPGRIHLP